MKNITDDDLILLYYGEHDDPALAATVAGSEELSRRFEALSAELANVDALIPPPRNDDYGAEVWRRISPRLSGERQEAAPGWRNWLVTLHKPRLSLAGAFSLVLVFAIAFTLGREGARNVEVTGPATDTLSLASLDTGQLLASSISDHLEQLNVALTQFANSSRLPADMPEHATDMLLANRLYRQAAETRGDQKLASFLADLEPMLIELAYEAYKTSPATRDRMQQQVRDDLLFRIRVMNQQLNNSQISL